MRFLPIFSVAAAFAVVGPAPAQQTQPPDEGYHIVDPGDTLWDLARRYLSNPFRWPEIFSVNRETVEDPDLIYPLERLRIPGATGEALARVPADAAARDVTAVATPASIGRTVFYPAAPPGAAEAEAQVRARAQLSAPPVQRGAYLGAGLLVPESSLTVVGELVEVVAPTVIPRTAEPQIQPYDRIFVTVDGSVGVGDRFQLLRPGEAMPPFGRIYRSTGIAEVLAVDGSVATVEIEILYDEVRLGDLAVPLPEFGERIGVQPAPAGGLDGVLLALHHPQPLVAREDLAFVNLGAASGVVEGDEFIVYIPETRASWGTRPAIDVARVQVVRAELLTSAVRVIEMEHPAIEPGLPVRLVAKMP